MCMPNVTQGRHLEKKMKVLNRFINVFTYLLSENAHIYEVTVDSIFRLPAVLLHPTWFPTEYIYDSNILLIIN